MDSNVVTVSLTIAPVNDAPVAVDDTFSSTEGTLLDVPLPGVLANDTDAEGDFLTASLTSGPSHGHLVFPGSGAFAYTPNAGFTGSDSFTYTASDGTLSSGSATVTITVSSRSTPDDASTSVDTPVTTNVLANDGLDGSPVEEAHYCYDGFDAACGGSDSSGARGTLGRISRISDKAGSVEMSYDTVGRETAESRAASGGSSLVTGRIYDDNGDAVTTTYPSGVQVTRTFDETGRESAISWAAGAYSGTLAAAAVPRAALHHREHPPPRLRPGRDLIPFR